MPFQELSDEKTILLQVAAGDERAFALLFEKEHKKINSFALKLTRSKELAEEIVQDVFLKLWMNRSELETIDNWGGYLNRVVRNHSFNVLRRLAQETLAAHEIGRQNTELDMDTELNIDFRETRKLVNEAVAALPSQQQKVYNLCHVEGLKYAEAAERLNVSPETIKAHMKQALRNIRKYLNRYAPFIIFSPFFYPNNSFTDHRNNQATGLKKDQAKIFYHGLPR